MTPVPQVRECDTVTPIHTHHTFDCWIVIGYNVFMKFEFKMPGYHPPDTQIAAPPSGSSPELTQRDLYTEELMRIRGGAENKIVEITNRIYTDYESKDNIAPENLQAELEAWVKVAHQITWSLIRDLLVQQSLEIESANSANVKLEDQAPVLSWFQKATNFFRHAISRSDQSAEASETPAINPDPLTSSEIASATDTLEGIYHTLVDVFSRLPNLRSTALLRAILVTSIVLTLLPTASANAPDSLSDYNLTPPSTQATPATDPDHLNTPLPGYLSQAFTPAPTDTSPATPTDPPSAPPSQPMPAVSAQTSITVPTVKHPTSTPTTSDNEDFLSQSTTSKEPIVTPYPIERRVLHDTIFEEPSDYELERIERLINESSINVVDLRSPIYDDYDPPFKEIIGKTNITIVVRDGDQWYIQGHGSIISHYNQIFFVTANHVFRNPSLFWLENTDSKQLPNIYLIIPNLDGYDYLKMTIPFSDLEQISESSNTVGEGLCYFNLENSFITLSEQPLKTISNADLRSRRGFDDEGEELKGMIFPTTMPHGLYITWGGGQNNSYNGHTRKWLIPSEENPMRPGDSGRGVIYFDSLTHEWYLAGLTSSMVRDLLVPVTVPGIDNTSHMTAVEFPE